MSVEGARALRARERSRRGCDASWKGGEGGGVGEQDVGLVVSNVAWGGGELRASAEWAQALRAVRERAEVMSAYYVTGETDFMLIVSAKDMQDYEAFTRDFFYNNPDIKGFKTTVVMDRIKASFTLPV